MDDATHTAVLEAEQSFFAALLAADGAALDAVLAPDFDLVDVMAGQVVPRQVLLDLVGSGELRFLAVQRDPAEVTIRFRTGTAVAVGATRMTMAVPDGQVTVDSRYTHVYVTDDDRWRLLSAQGTPIAG